MEHLKLFISSLFELNNLTESEVRDQLLEKSLAVTGHLKTDKCVLAFAISQSKLKEVKVSKPNQNV